MFHLKLLINFLSLSIVGSNWLVRPRSRPFGPAPFLCSERAQDLLRAASLGLLHVLDGGEQSITFRRPHDLGSPNGTTIINMNKEAILKVNLEDLPDDQKALIDQAAKEFREKCLLSYSRTRDSVVKKTPLPSVLLHGQSEDVEARTIAHLVHKMFMKPLHTTIRCWPTRLTMFWKKSSLEHQLIKLG